MKRQRKTKGRGTKKARGNRDPRRIVNTRTDIPVPPGVLDDKVLVLDWGAVELHFPNEWEPSFHPEQCVKIEDPQQRCDLKVTHHRLKGQPGALSPLEPHLRYMIDNNPDPTLPADYDVRSEHRGDLEMAMTDFSLVHHDPSGEVGPAHAHWLIATNDLIFAYVTFYYWADAAARAEPVWARVVETLQLGRKPMKSPLDHWTVREADG